MQIKWEITDKDIKKIKEFMKAYADNPLVKQRKENNLSDMFPKIDRSSFWKALCNSLLTSRQRSGPGSPIFNFSCLADYPLEYTKILKLGNVSTYVQKSLSDFGGIRFFKNIGGFLEHNIGVLESGFWDEIFNLIDKVKSNRDIVNERALAMLLKNNLKGLGPKQSRNLIQMLGISQYEIPLDSRIMKWFNNFGFPIQLSSNALSDDNYYNLVLDGIQTLCGSANVSPCILDAAIFASFDGDAWTEETAAVSPF